MESLNCVFMIFGLEMFFYVWQNDEFNFCLLTKTFLKARNDEQSIYNINKIFSHYRSFKIQFKKFGILLSQWNSMIEIFYFLELTKELMLRN